MKFIKNDDESSLSHTKWNCQYHIVFIPKYRRKAIYSKLRSDIGKYLRRLCEYKGAEIVEANACPDHIHMLVKIPPKLSISSFMGYLKGKSSLMIFEEHANLKYNYGNRHFWAQGYYVSTVGLKKYRPFYGRIFIFVNVFKNYIAYNIQTNSFLICLFNY